MALNVSLQHLRGAATSLLLPKLATPPTTLSEAYAITGPLSYPSKMPCPAWGIEIAHCKTGSKLQKVPNSPCSICYAGRGRARFPSVISARQRRLEGSQHPCWVEAMTIVIGNAVSIGVPYFRWFDSGDLQSLKQLRQICQIAEALPQIKFWLPTQEHNWARKVQAPKNLVIRLSSRTINIPEQDDVFPTSSVGTTYWTCSAEVHERYECGPCRACWNPEVRHVIYHAR